MEFRRDIEGLRAVAVLSILLFHIDHTNLPGGFIGVDIFFVISGYLITGNIWRDLNNKSFSIAHFYLKRIRRLFPALFFMLVVIFLAVYLSGINNEINMYGRSALSSLYYVSNIFFYTQNDYFSPDLELNPLLHTWSLSVEEQFYLIFPFIFIILIKAKKYTVYILSGIFLVSLLLSEHLVNLDESAAFFLSPFRFWQFLTGSLIAIYGHNLLLINKASNFFSIIGAGLIALSLLFFSSYTAFPGINALIPTIGTALVILGSKSTATLSHRILSSQIPSFIGKISYSVYLWHWPIIVLYKLNYNPDIEKTDKVFLFIASFIAGYISWKIIEQPTRKISLVYNSRLLITYTFTALAVVTLSSVIFINYADSLSDPKKNHLASYSNYKMDVRSGVCFLNSGADDPSLFDESLCINTKETNNVLLLGDSHAAHYYSELKAIYPDYNISQVTSSGCKPLIYQGELRFHLQGELRCTTLVKNAFEKTIFDKKFDVVILAGRWQLDDVPQLHNTIKYLENKVGKIIVIGPVIEYTQALPNLLARSYVENGAEIGVVTKARKYEDRLAVDSAIRMACLGTEANYVSALDKLCPQGQCITIIDKIPVQFDYGHLTNAGAKIVLDGIL